MHRVAFETRDVDTACQLARRHQPDVIIVDLAMQGSGLGGLSLIHTIRADNPRARILVFSMHSDPIIVSRALQTGATGYLLKDTSWRTWCARWRASRPARRI